MSSPCDVNSLNMKFCFIYEIFVFAKHAGHRSNRAPWSGRPPGLWRGQTLTNPSKRRSLGDGPASAVAQRGIVEKGMDGGGRTRGVRCRSGCRTEHELTHELLKVHERRKVGELPASLLEHKLLVPGAGSGGGLDRHLGDRRHAAGRPPLPALAGLRRRQARAAELARARTGGASPALRGPGAAAPWGMPLARYGSRQA